MRGGLSPTETCPPYYPRPCTEFLTIPLSPESIHPFDGGYTEYVARTGQEAPGLHS
ncbi:hypothetical protein SAMN04244559_02952 [Magnetospirillum fulvum]|uniref:Uncharacterized protein n=1 Tax=Magnetospirillum fulvum TaxID=1082 RepID=A0A1H6JB15_MAGFU|nr:hypothetical protein SAMN04244559_02952 [Magnetospirillum fulvum]